MARRTEADPRGGDSGAEPARAGGPAAGDRGDVVDRRFQFVVPARKGSKGIPDKNRQALGDFSLFEWAVWLARSCSGRLIIKSDDYGQRDISPDIRHVKRPPQLATDDAKMIDVLRHLIDDGHVDAGVEALVILQPTNPFRTADLVKQCCKRYVNDKLQSLVTLKPVHEHPARMYVKRRKRVRALMPQRIVYNANRQELPEVYIRDGAVYIVSIQALNKGSQYGSRRGYFIREDEININIDTRLDLILARAVRDEWSKANV
jgi:CMP-N,N'-diacetyllegionaminic acid synthase